MTRCVTLPALAAALLLPLAVQAQRNFPQTALRGEMVVVAPPEIRLNGQAARLAPGSRIRDENNLLAMSGALVDRPLLVNYTLDPHDLVLDVWILTPHERSRQPWPRSLEEARLWFFNAAAQTWTRP